MAPKSYAAMYKRFVEHLALKKAIDLNLIRKLSYEFAVETRGKNDLYARKYHAYIYTEWCVNNNVHFPDDWNPEGFWSGNFS